MPTLEQLREAFSALEHDPLVVFKATGLRPSWQRAFLEGRSKDPGYVKVCSLVKYLTQHSKLEVVTHEI
jgi:hypothetical protein